MNLIFVVALVVIVVVVVLALITRWQSTTKDWCVMLYFVAKDHPELDAKLQQCLDDLKKLPCKTFSGESSNPPWSRVHVVYRAIWGDPTKPPEGEVLHWKPFAPKVGAFPGVSIGLDLTADLHAWFNWAYANCPADRYAVYFWGHSFGPGGLFALNQPVIVDPPPAPPTPALTLASVTSGLKTIVAKRAERMDRGVRMASLPGPAPSTPPLPPPPSAPPKVEMVLFQDCWMSTLETMYALQETVRYMVGSQSLVPIGLDSNDQPNAAATWPYEKIIDALLTDPKYADGVLTALCDYFSTPDARYPTPTIPFSLLDLGPDTNSVSARLDPHFRALVTALAPLGRSGRRQLIESKNLLAGRLTTEVSGYTRAGDAALIDIVTLCDYLQTPAAYVGVVFPANQDAAIAAAALAVRNALLGDGSTWPLIKRAFEIPGLPTDLLGFKGVSALYKGDDRPLNATLMNLVGWSGYKGLDFPQAVLVSPGTCWTTYAFEHSVSNSATVNCN